MMALDLQDSYDKVESKIKAAKTFLEVTKDRKKLLNDQLDNLTKKNGSISSTIEDLKQQKKRFQREVRSQLSQLLQISQLNLGNGSSSLNYIKSRFIQVALNIEPKVIKILLNETVKALGCSQQQTFPDGLGLYIKVSSVDIQNLLKRDPNEEVIAAAYEKEPPSTGQRPFSMNRALWECLQNVNVPIDVNGVSGNKLFEISYVTSDGVITGDFFKIVLAGGSINNLNKVVDFLVDYYRSIKVIDLSNIFLQLIDLLTGAFSFSLQIGVGELEIKNKFSLLLQRILGLCFDSKKEIDVTGNSKISELDGIDQSFFEFNSIDLRNIDTNVTNTRNGVVEFEDCDNVLLPVDSQSLIDAVLSLNRAESQSDQQAIAESLTETITDNPQWKLLFPNSVALDLKIDLSFLESLPKAIMFALLSPKVILPLLIMSKALGQTISDEVEDFLTFIKSFFKFNINMMSKISAVFIEELFYIIEKDIKLIARQILNEIARETANKKLAIILKLVELLLIVAKFVDDWRKCKSVVDEILALLAFIGNPLSLPGPLLAATQLLSGFSSARANINTIEEFQKLGLPTGPMPDGSPNLMLSGMFGSISAQQKEENENGKVQILAPPLIITPAGITKPSGNLFGKKM
jgi:hypothetical protein